MPDTSIALDAALFPLSALCSLGASALLVSRLERGAAALRLSEAILGLVVALAADSPEITSAITASAHGQRSIGSGVVFGSNVFNLAALLGLSALVAGRVQLHRRVVLLDGVTATWVAVAAVVVVSTGLGAGAGLVLVLLVVLPYVFVSGASARTLLRCGLPGRVVAWLTKAVAEEEMELRPVLHPDPDPDPRARRTVNRADWAVALVCVVVVVAASAEMESSAQSIGAHFGLSQLVIGGVVLAAVTSLPNAVGAVYLALHARGAAVLSEAMNSNMLNVLVGLFLPGIFVGIAGAAHGGALVAIWYACLTVAVLLMAFAGRGLARVEGAAIVAAYLVFVAVAIAAPA